MNEPWSEYTIWKTKASYFSWVRGQLRRIWSKSPIKIQFKNSKLRPLTQEEKKSGKYHTSTKKVGQCEYCLKWFAGSHLEVDHKVGEASCVDFKTAEQFMWHCLSPPKGGLCLACKPCHKQKSYSERTGLSFEDAGVEKQVIEKLKQSVSKQKTELMELYCFTEDEVSNATKRKECYRKVLKEE